MRADALSDPSFFESLQPMIPVAEGEKREMSLWSEGAIRFDYKKEAVQFRVDARRKLDVAVLRTFNPVRLYMISEEIWGLPSPADQGDET